MPKRFLKEPLSAIFNILKHDYTTPFAPAKIAKSHIMFSPPRFEAWPRPKGLIFILLLHHPERIYESILLGGLRQIEFIAVFLAGTGLELQDVVVQGLAG